MSDSPTQLAAATRDKRNLGAAKMSTSDPSLNTDPSISVSTDQSDYAPGSTVQITADVAPGSTVEFRVMDDVGAGPDGISGTADDVLIPLSASQPAVASDSSQSGVIQTSWVVPSDAAGQMLMLSAMVVEPDGTV